MVESHLKFYKAKIYHKRFRPKINEFLYTGFYMKFSIDELDRLKSTLFSVNRFNIFSFYTKDHGYRDHRPLRTWANDMLELAQIKPVSGDIQLQTFPRVLAHVFNPVSFWYCYEENHLKAIICEVNNTFGETHSYVLSNDALKNKQLLAKEFHVSPFFDIKGKYEFDFTRDDYVGINYFVDNELELITSIKGKEIAFNSINILKLFFRYPLYSFMVISLIHYQALKLFFKKCTFYSLPKKIDSPITTNKSV